VAGRASRARVLAVGLVLAAIAPLAGCGGGGGGSNGPVTLTVYVSVPLHGERQAEGRAIVNGAKLALAEQDGKVGDLRIRAVYLDDTAGGPRWSPAAAAADARRAAEDSSAIGYIGELDSGATRFSLPITNQAEIAQISPGATAVDLTRDEGGADPDQYRPSGKQTFARVVPADDVQARAAALLAKQLAARRVAVVTDGSEYGRTIDAAFSETAVGLGLDARAAGRAAPVGGVRVREVPSADAMYFAGTPSAAASAAIPSAAPDADEVILPDPFLPESFHICGDLLKTTYVSSSFRDPSRLPARARGFLRSYRARYGAPAPAAAYGYEAMALLLDSIRRAGGGGDNRDDVIDALLSTRDRRSILGEYSIDGAGDTTLDLITIYDLGACPVAVSREVRAPR
jgi:branched-chain amino acid transport system substrate-binding protein